MQSRLPTNTPQFRFRNRNYFDLYSTLAAATEKLWAASGSLRQRVQRAAKAFREPTLDPEQWPPHLRIRATQLARGIRNAGTGRPAYWCIDDDAVKGVALAIISLAADVEIYRDEVLKRMARGDRRAFAPPRSKRWARRHLSARITVDRLHEALMTYCGAKRPLDDITAAIVKVVGDEKAHDGSR